MTILEKICGLFGDDIQHLHGNLFRVKRSRIRIAKSGVSVENGKLVYGNPRWFLNKDGNPSARGIDESSKMEELRNSIQEDGLENPFRLRVLEDDGPSLEIVNGERRFRCLDTLCSNNFLCKDPSGEMKPASEVYEWVDCRVEFMDDSTALGVALRPNETSEVIGDLANINVVKVLRSAGYDDQDILKATGKCLSWLRETETIIGLDEVCFEHFRCEKISRKVALHLALIENAEERLSLLERLKESAEARHAERVKSLSKKSSSAKMTREIESAAAEWAKRDGDMEAEAKHSQRAKSAEKRAKAHEEEQRKASSKPATANSRDLGKVVKPAPLSHRKIKSIYMDLISALIENEGWSDADEDGNCYVYDVAMLSSVLSVLQAIMDGNKEVFDVLSVCAAVEEDAEDEVEADISDEDSDSDSDSDSDDDSDSEDEDDDSDSAYAEVESDTEYDEDPDLVREFEEELASMDDNQEDD